MYAQLKKHYLVFARSLEAAELTEDFTISAVSIIIIVRGYLNLFGFPQLGGGGFHIAHVLWGGLLLLIALILNLVFLNKEARRLSAIAGGIGFGLFVDEIGKFITSDNNYFFHPTFALIYMIFILLFVIVRSILRSNKITDKEYAMNALEVMKEVVFYDLDEDEKKKALQYLAKSDPKNPIVGVLLQTLHSYEIEENDEDISLVTSFKRKIKTVSTGLISNKTVSQIIVSIFVISSIVRFFFAISGIEWAWDFWEWGRQISSIIVCLIVISGLNWQRKGHKIVAFQKYRRASLVSILLVQFFDFYHDQLSAIFYLIINLVIYITLSAMIERYKMHTKTL